MLVEIVTRHLSTRPGLLRRNQASLEQLTSRNWVQTILPDDVGRGVAWANAQLRTFEPTGDYVWILDDDDECILPTMARDLETIADAYHPQAIMVRMDHGPELGILPSDRGWRGHLHEGGVGCSAMISSRATWMAYRHAWGERYAGDFDYVRAVQRAGVHVYWWDVVASKISNRNIGKAGE